MKTEDRIAVDIHTHAKVWCWNPFDSYGEAYDRAADKCFGFSKRPTIEDTITHCREMKIGWVMFTVVSESQLGRRRIPNEEICEAASKNSDMMMAFVSVDPHKGKMGARGPRADRAARRQGLQVAPDAAGLFALRPHDLSALRGDC